MRSFYLFFVAAIFVIGCAKNGSVPQPDPVKPTTPTGTNSANKLLLSATYYSGSTMTAAVTYDYNSTNQLTGYVETSAGVYKSHLLTYNADGTLKKETIVTVAGSAYREFSYAGGVPVLITYVDETNAKNNYTIKVKTNGTLTTEGTFYSLDAHSVEQPGSVIAFDYKDQNLTKQTATYNGITQSITEDEYGTKKSPFINTGDKWLISTLPYNNKNELLKETQTSGTDVTTTTYDYTYDEFGYPTKVDRTTTISGNLLPPTKTSVSYLYLNAK